MIRTPFNPFPELKTERLLLRRITFSDAPEMLEMRGNPENNEFLFRPLATSIDEMPGFIQTMFNLEEQQSAINWCLSLGPGQPMLGTVCIWNIDPDNHRGELGYILMKPHRGKGLMTEAIKAAIDFGFKEMNLNAITAFVNAQNKPSFQILEKLGFVREAYFKQ